jgi:enamine deaminase RidA (YjgF/YER057c/UK114 family)
MTAPSIARINPPELGTPPGYSQVVEVSANRVIFVAGQTALDRDGNVVGAKAISPSRRRRCSTILRSHFAQPDARPPIWSS